MRAFHREGMPKLLVKVVADVGESRSGRIVRVEVKIVARQGIVR